MKPLDERLFFIHRMNTAHLTIWGNADSVNVQKVLWCFEELGLAYRRVDAGKHFGVVNTPEFLAMNPNGLVPTIDDGGFVVWESNAIVRYLASKHAQGTLWPVDPAARANADRWMDWANSTLWPTMVPLFRAFMRTPVERRDPSTIEASRLETLDVLRVLDAQLVRTAYVGGDAFTMGDIAVGCAAWRWMALPVERPPLPGFERWFASLAAREAYRKVVMVPLS
ncbi:MAG TPA: glutathione S-transferase family protein [Usitatibacter sp.]|nr:glutathione S-transferase family protein [Usitatibacter sp.]